MINVHYSLQPRPSGYVLPSPSQEDADFSHSSRDRPFTVFVLVVYSASSERRTTPCILSSHPLNFFFWRVVCRHTGLVVPPAASFVSIRPDRSTR